jgi:hypothetical protein
MGIWNFNLPRLHSHQLVLRNDPLAPLYDCHGVATCLQQVLDNAP